MKWNKSPRGKVLHKSHTDAGLPVINIGQIRGSNYGGLMKIYSPSQTAVFSRCKWEWYLYRFHGVTESYVAKRDMAAAVGGGVGGALAAYYKQLEETGTKWTVDQVCDLAAELYHSRIQMEVDKGREVLDIPEKFTYPDLVPKMVHAYFKNPAILPDWKVKGTEFQCAEDNTSFIDAWGECDRGVWQLDWKCKMYTKPGARDQALLTYRNSWQMSHYVWSLKNLLGEYPKFTRISMLFGTPSSESMWADFEVDHNYMLWWEESAKAIWADMERTEALIVRTGLDKEIPNTPFEAADIVPMAPSHYNGFFKCNFYDLCFTYDGQPGLTSQFITVDKERK